MTYYHMTVGELMLYDFLKIDRGLATPVYRQLHDELRRAIEEELLSPGQKLLSIRAAAGELSLSRMTVETAYQQLCMEGYLVSRPQRGYFVAEKKEHFPKNFRPAAGQARPRFDFGSRRVDADHADLKLWQKCMRSVLSEETILTSYGDAQGEPELRAALATYAFEARGVRAEPDQIVIGAGTQPLLTLLCGLVSGQGAFTAGLDSPGFPQAEQVLSDFGIAVCHMDKDEEKIPSDVDMYIYLPSRTVSEGFSAEMERRKSLSRWRKARPLRYILEDDYNGELRFQSRPLPALQGMDEGVIFLGSFSKLLLPSVRIAYMVLPEGLKGSYLSKVKHYNQTAGKVEQLALAEYIKQGRLERHLRRLRRLYQKKSLAMEAGFAKNFSNIKGFELWETELRYLLTLDCGLDADTLVKKAEESGVSLSALSTADRGAARLVLSFAGIALEDIEPGLERLAGCLDMS